MESVKATLPEALLQQIEGSVLSTLGSSCSALVSHFCSNDVCSQLLQQLMDPGMTSCAKDAAVALEFKCEGNAAFGTDAFQQALGCYTKALRYAPLNSDSSIMATILVNRASTLHKLRLLDAAARDSTRAIGLQPRNSKAWYRRGKIRADLRSYGRAIEDMEEALALEDSVGGRRQVMLTVATLRGALSDMGGLKNRSSPPKLLLRKQIRASEEEVSSHWTSEKQWGLHSNQNVQPGSLVLWEEPCAAIILKAYRDSSCHYCFGQLPADPIACDSCAIPLYCSERCRDHAKGCHPSPDIGTCTDDSHKAPTSSSFRTGCSSSSFNGSFLVAQADDASADRCQGTSHMEDGHAMPDSKISWWGEHRHECGGASWSAVLPTDVVLAARMYAKSLTIATRGSHHLLNKQLDDLCHHYEELSARDKVDLHVLAVVVAHCLQSSLSPQFAGGTYTTDSLAAKLVLLIAQVRSNAMAIVTISSPSGMAPSTTAANAGPTTSALCTVEQVKVAQAVYATGSRLNHACEPNVHASFRSRDLIIRTIKPIVAGTPLELCYGPQVGEMTRAERQTWLWERYFFTCTCPACMQPNQSDLLLLAFQCGKAGCSGVVLGPDSVEPDIAGTFEYKSAVDGHNIPSLQGELVKSSGYTKQGSLSLMGTSSKGSSWFEGSKGRLQNGGQCLTCGAVVDIQRASKTAKASLEQLQRLESKFHSPSAPKDPEDLRRAALEALSCCRSVLHASSKQLAKGEDLVARLLCAIGQYQDAVTHCEAAIQVYHKDHIAVANERIKLTSIAYATADMACGQKNLTFVDGIMRTHYGPDYHEMFPYIASLLEQSNY